MDNLITTLQKKYSLSLTSAKRFAAIISLHKIEKGEIFVKKGSPNSKEYLVLDGICRTYIIDAKGKDISLAFFTANTCISPNLTRTKSNQSILNIQALTAVQLARFSSEDLMTLMNAHREIEVWGNAVLQRELLQKVNKEISQISKNAKERLLDFRTEYPLLENLIAHSYISSYLGITNVSLSRLRKELSNN